MSKWPKGVAPFEPQFKPCKRCAANAPVKKGWPSYPLGADFVPLCLVCWEQVSGRAYRQTTPEDAAP